LPEVWDRTRPLMQAERHEASRSLSDD
jgi:hypothetical protein